MRRSPSASRSPSPRRSRSTRPSPTSSSSRWSRSPGRAIVNSINLEAGRDKADIVIPLAIQHGAALIALTIDEVGMAKTAERKVEIAKRIKEIACDEHGLDPELLIFDVLTFTLTTGDDEWKPSAVETIKGIREVKAALPGVKTSLGVSNVSFGVGQPARAVLNSVFLHHCVEAGLDLAMVNPNHITPYGEISEEERELANDLVYNRREDALQRFIEHFESAGGEAEVEVANPTEGMEPEEALHWHILRRKKDGVEAQIDAAVREARRGPGPQRRAAARDEGSRRQVRRRRADPAVRAAERRGHEARGRPAGELPRPHRGLHQGHRRPGDRLRRRARHRQVLGQHDPHQQRLHGRRPRQAGPRSTIIEAAKEHDATAIGLSALLVSTSKQMPLAVKELEREGLEYPVLIGGAAINRAFGYRALYVNGLDDSALYGPGVFYCKDAFEGLARDGQDRRGRAARRAAGQAEGRRRRVPREGRGDRGPDHDGHRPLRRRAPTSRSPSPRSGACARSRSTSTRSTRTSTPTCCSSCTGAARASRARPGSSCWRAPTRTRASARAWSACGASRPTCTRARCWGTSPATAKAMTSWCSTRATARRSCSASSTRASRATTTSAFQISSARRRAASSTSSHSRP